MNTLPDLLRELDRTDRRTLALVADLDERQLAVPYDRGVNPPLWEVGHAAFFYEYFLLRPCGDAAPRMPGCDEVWDSFEIRHEDRWDPALVPDRRATLDYYRRVLDEVRERLRTAGPREHYLARYGICHQNMHVESMIWCRQTVGHPRPAPEGGEARTRGGTEGGAREGAPGERAARESAPPQGLAQDGPWEGTPREELDAAVPGGPYRIGMPPQGGDYATTGFSFDNERPAFEAEVAPFRISKTLVSNREFLEFVESGVYGVPSLWSFRGRAWLRTEKPAHPLYWRRDRSGAWQVRHFDRWVDLPLDAPVLHVSYFEAEAYCNWAGRRLPTELEWEAAARGPEGRLFPWGDAMDPARVDMDACALGQGAVDALPQGASPFGCLQMLGTAWEWTSSQFLPYDGFALDVYPYMSTLQFGSHKTTRGGSCATSSCLIRNTYRQAYMPDRRDAFAGFRTCAR